MRAIEALRVKPIIITLDYIHNAFGIPAPVFDVLTDIMGLQLRGAFQTNKNLHAQKKNCPQRHPKKHVCRSTIKCLHTQKKTKTKKSALPYSRAVFFFLFFWGGALLKRPYQVIKNQRNKGGKKKKGSHQHYKQQKHKHNIKKTHTHKKCSSLAYLVYIFEAFCCPPPFFLSTFLFPAGLSS